MDDLKLRAGEKIGALHEAAKTAAGNGKSRVEDVVQQTVEVVRKIRESFSEIWHNELIAESRQRIAAWSRDTIQRIKEGTPPLSPVLLYEELVALFENRVWRRSVIIFMCGCVVGGGCGLAAGLRAAARTPTGPHARALLSQPDHSVLLVEDAVAPGAGPGEVLVRVQAFSVCPEDRGVLRGRGHALRALTARNTSLTVGRGFAGVVLDVGVGVSALEMGDEVWGCVSEWAGGAAAELLTVRSTRVSRRPRALAADSAASLPWAGALALSALQRLHYAQGGCKGKRVAVMGAASGEGCALVQLLANSGAHVTAAAAAHAAQAMRARGAAECVTSLGASWLQLEQTAARVGPWDAVVACGAAGAPPARPHNTQALLKSSDGAARRHSGSAAAVFDLGPTADALRFHVRRRPLHLPDIQVGVGVRLAHGLAGAAGEAHRRAEGVGAARRRGTAHPTAGQGVLAAGVRKCACARMQRRRSRDHSHSIPIDFSG